MGMKSGGLVGKNEKLGLKGREREREYEWSEESELTVVESGREGLWTVVRDVVGFGGKENIRLI